MAIKTKIGYGEKSKIQENITNGKLDAGDLILTKDTHEAVFIDETNTPFDITSRSVKEYTLNGTDLGALKNGQKIPKGTNIDDLLNMITQKAIHPTYSKPTVAVAKSGAGTAAGSYEAGTSITPVITATFNKNDGGDLTKLAILKGATEVATDTKTPCTYTGTAMVLGDETVSFKATAAYGDGPVKNNNLNQPDATGQIKAGTITSSAMNFVGQRNMFYGTGVGNVPALTSDVVRGLANKKLNPTNGFTFTIKVAIGQQHVCIAYPATLRDLTKVMYVETNDPGMASNFKKELVDVADARGGENGKKSYKVYTFEMAVPAAAPMTLEVTI